jgi:drug/metabolite transporter (DMT)-like permease
MAAAALRASSGATDVPLRRQDAPRLIAVAVIGGAVAPTLLAWGLQRVGATMGALLLNLEAIFTVLLARLFFHEHIGARVGFAVFVMAAGGAALTLDARGTTSWGSWGLLAVAAATAAWAADNTLTRPLAERAPLEVVLGKSGVGALITTSVAWLAGEPFPSALPAGVLLLCGATGYGLSLRLYLLAQRRIGAGRTGSVFALAPFLGAALSFAAGDRSGGTWTLVAAGLFGLGVYVHVTERHSHPHLHAPLEHEHLHRHPCEHHAHIHVPPFEGEHAHAHQHEGLEHDHEHAPDIHHDHLH